MVLGGLLYTLLLSNSGTGLIASEVHEGTLRLLVSKPISRSEILLAKTIGMFLGSYLYYVAGLLLLFSSFTCFSGANGSLLETLLWYIPGYLLYGLFILFVFGGVSLWLSLCVKKKVTALLIMMVVIFMIFAFVPFVRLLCMHRPSFQTMYHQYHLYWLDINYHLSAIFHHFCQYAGGYRTGFEMIGSFTGLFQSMPADMDYLVARGHQFILNQSIPVFILEISYLLLGSACYVVSWFKMERKDI